MSPDETNELNAQRELQEEIGITLKVEDMKLIDQFKYSDHRTNVWGNIFFVKIDHDGKDLKI